MTRAPRRTWEFALAEPSPAGCPFCDLADRDFADANDLAVAIRDACPVNLGHILIIPRLRRVPRTLLHSVGERDLPRHGPFRTLGADGGAGQRRRVGKRYSVPAIPEKQMGVERSVFGGGK